MFDGTDYSHAGIWDGKNVTEALGDGVVTRSLGESVSSAKFVGIARLMKKGNELGSPKLPSDPVLTKGIKFFQDNPSKYAYEEILLLAVLALTRRIPVPFLRGILDHAAGVINDILARGKEPVICSELVFRCFLLAGPDYVPHIVGASRFGELLSLNARVGQSAALTDDEYERSRLVTEYLDLYLHAKQDTETRPFEIKATNPNFVTPGDLFKSPDLKFQGILEGA